MFKSEFDRRQAGTWDESRQRTTTTICTYCGVGCNLELHEQDNEIVKVTSPLDHPITYGNLCVKGRFGFQFVQNRAEPPSAGADSEDASPAKAADGSGFAGNGAGD
jgi:anaerobic selenocysteine-containing dehydrogenase